MKSFPPSHASKTEARHASGFQTGVIPALENFHLSPAHNYFGHHGRAPSSHPTLAVCELQCHAGRGIVGDRFYDYRPDYAGQITFFASEVFEELQHSLGGFTADASATRRNVITRGVNLQDLMEGEFCLQGVWFRGAGECKPCYWMDSAISPGSESWLRGRGGLRARILTDGVLTLGAANLVYAARPTTVDLSNSSDTWRQ